MVARTCGLPHGTGQKQEVGGHREHALPSRVVYENHVVYDEEPTFHVVTVDRPGWRPAELCAALAEPLRL